MGIPHVDRKLLVSFLLFLLQPGGARASQTLSLTTQEIPFFVIDENRGTFMDLTKEIAKKIGVQISVELYPNFRAIDNFKKKKTMLFIPGNHPNLAGYDYYETEPVYTKNIYIYSVNSAPVSELKELEGKRVGITMGYTYPSALPHVKGIDIQEAQSDEANLRKLHAHRIDAFLGEDRSVNQALETLGYKDVVYNKSKVLASEPIFYAIQKTPEGQGWLKKFNDVIRAMKKSGQLDKIVLKK